MHDIYIHVKADYRNRLPNKGGLSFEVTIADVHGDVLHEYSEERTPSSKNSLPVAEYSAILYALIWLYNDKRFSDRILFFGLTRATCFEMEDGISTNERHLPIYRRCEKAVSRTGEDSFFDVSFIFERRQTA